MSKDGQDDNQDSLFAVPELELPPVQDDLETGAEVVARAAETGAVAVKPIQDELPKVVETEEQVEEPVTVTEAPATESFETAASTTSAKTKKVLLAGAVSAMVIGLRNGWAVAKKWMGENKAATGAIIGGTAALVGFLVWFLGFRVSMPADVVSPNGGDGDDNQTAEEVVIPRDLVCTLDGATTDSIYGFDGFLQLDVLRVITFTSQDMPRTMSQDLVYAFDSSNAVTAAFARFSGSLEERFPAEGRPFMLTILPLHGGKNGENTISVSASGELLRMTDATVAQFGLVPDNVERPDGETIRVANYSREDLARRFVGQGWRCE
ncbi:hypothetical protein FWH13_02470 [Candidatus Saccharibacteria bacterium]|nr:hypothetical protein [Candidatus Saccharibacteria bacterium]